jgi:SAM-dependent methyltransferase
MITCDGVFMPSVQAYACVSIDQHTRFETRCERAFGVLSREQVKAIYDRFGARQDRQGYYEDAALAALIAQADFTRARRVCEFGCGTGRLAEQLLARQLPARAVYYGLDLSSTMVRLASVRLAPYGRRTVVARADGFPHLPAAEQSVGRFVSTYVFDLLPPHEIRALLAEAQRILTPGGRICLVGLTRGTTRLGRLVSCIWTGIYTLTPAHVGGCRPLAMRDFLNDRWRLEYSGVVTAWGIPSEVVIATPVLQADASG